MWLLLTGLLYQQRGCWRLGDALYFCFVTMETTIGLGDFTPGLTGTTGDIAYYVVIFVGLAIMGMFLQTLVAFFLNIDNKARQRTKDLKKSAVVNAITGRRNQFPTNPTSEGGRAIKLRKAARKLILQIRVNKAKIAVEHMRF
jgi:hypothetical protein